MKHVLVRDVMTPHVPPVSEIATFGVVRIEDLGAERLLAAVS